jgi:hypothetical protein
MMRKSEGVQWVAKLVARGTARSQDESICLYSYDKGKYFMFTVDRAIAS